MTVTKAKSSDEKNSFRRPHLEDGISELEEIVHRMESGDAPLDSLFDYCKGMSLLKHCRENRFRRVENQEVSVQETTAGNPSNQR